VIDLIAAFALRLTSSAAERCCATTGTMAAPVVSGLSIDDSKEDNRVVAVSIDR
jgi:hypothetical protein